MSTNTTPLKIIGKEFLYDENLFITNYNPFLSTNTSGIQGLYSSKSFTGKLYIFDKTNYNEPTREQFINIKMISEMSQFKKEAGIPTINYFTVTINTDYTIKTSTTPSLRSLSLDKNASTLSIVPNIGTQPASIFDKCFCVFIIDKDTINNNDKTYADMTSLEQNFMWLLPESVITTTGSLTEGITLNITNPSKRSVTKTSGFYSGPFEEKYPGYTENMCKPYRINSSLNGNLVPDNLPTLFTTTTDLPEYAGWSKFVSYNNYVYWIGGYNLTGASVAITTSIRRAPINENGDIGTYINIGTTPANIGQAQAFIINDKLWLVGCFITTTSSYSLNTYWCQINEDGSLGTWNSGPVLPDNVGASNGAVIVNNKIYFFGGYTTSGTVYKNHIICGDIGSDGLIKLFYKLSTTMSFLVSDVSITFSYGNKIFIIPGYNRTTSAYDTNVYSFIVNPDGTLQNMINENNPFTNIAGLHTKILLIGSKVWAIGGTNTATTGYTENGMVADLNIINGEVKLSTWRNAGAFPIAMHGCDGIIITKKYIYLYPLREGVTWVNSKKVYRADISSYNIGSKNDYSQDSFHYKNTIVLPSFYNKYNSTNLGGVLDNTFVDGSFTLSIPQYKLKSDGTYILITDEEILSYVQSIKVNNNPLTLITNSDITIQRPSDQTLETGKSLKVQVQVLIDEELLQTINYLSEYNKPDLFGDGSCKAWYQFNGNMYDSIRGIDTDGLGVSGLTTDTNLNVTYGYNPTAVRKTYLGSGSNVNAQTQTLGNPHGNSTTVTISAWLMWNGVDNGVPFGILDTSNGAFRQCLYFKTAFMGLNTANGDVYGISSTGFSGVWKHVVIQFNTGSYGKLWIDGVAQTLTQKLTTPIVGNQTVAGNTAYIFLTGYANFGNIDDLRVFDRALTDIEVKSLYRESSLSVSPDQTKLFVKDPAYPALTDKYISNDITIDKINYINGRPWEQQYYIDRPDPSNLTFTTDTSLPFVCAWGEVALVKNKVYIFGGSRSGANNTSVNVSTINVASINEDGTIGTFVVSPSVLPVVMQQPKVLVIGSRIYLFGGVNTVYLATVYSCAINSDGTLGSWRTETSLPYASVIPNIIITKNRLYLLGGCTTSAVMNNTIYTCNINDDGSLGTWINTKNTYPILTYSSCVTQIKNKIYVIGGIASTTTWAGLNNIYTATINDDGTITTFTSVGTFPTNICSANCFTTKTRIYVIGGVKDSTTVALNQVYSAPIDINGNIGTWVAGPVLPYAKHCSNDLVVTSTYIYLLGGREYVSSGVWKDTAKVLRAPLSGGKNDYTDDTYDTIQYTTVSKKLNYIEQKQLTINASTKLDSLNPGITIDSVALDYNAKPTVIGMDFDTGTSLFEAPQLSSNQTTGVLVNTGKKVYLYGGRSDNSAALTATISNTLWVSNILNDGSLEGFTNIGTNSINLYDVSTYTYTTPTGQTFAYAFGGYTPGLTTNINTVSSIRRSLITADGSLGNWTIIDNIPYSCAANIIIVNPEDPSCFWLFVGDSYAAGVYTSYRNRVCYYKINVDGSLKLIYNQTLDQNYCTNANYVARDPKDNNLYLFMFGTEYAGDANIRKYRVNDSGYISTTGVIVGTIDHAKHSTYLMEDSDNVYVIGGVANYTGWKIGADNRVLKYSKQALMEATTNNPLGPVMEPTLSVPLNVAYYMMIKTPYAYYAVCPYTSSTTDGSAYTYQTTNRVFGFKINSSSLGSTGLTMIDTSFKISNDDLNNSEGLYKIIPNKLNNRLREELFSNLLVRSTQTLTRFGETIKFKDPVNGNIITLTDNTNPNAISQNEKFLIEYLVKLAVTDNLDKYNNYAYTNLYGQNTTGDYDLIIPELIFNIITDRNCVNLNKTVLTEYLNDATLNPASLGLTIPVGFNLDDSLYVLYKNKITSNTSTPITYTTTGMNLNMVKPLTIGYGAKLNEVSHIFIPQRNKSKVLNSSGFPFIPKNANYIDSTGSCVYKKKIADALIDYKTNEKVIQSYFNFFVSPTGNNANDGLTPYTPKATVGGCTDGTKVLLLPGTYTGIAADSNYGAYNKFASVFAGMNAHEVWGCGDSTIIDVPNGVSGIGLKSSVVPTRVAGTASLNNVKVIWRNTYQASEKDRWVVSYLSLQNGYARACGFTFYKVNFANQAGTVYNLAGWADNTRTDASDYIYFNNCTITGGTRLGVYVMELGLIQSVAEKSFYSTIGNNPMIPTHKNLIDNITDTIEFIPAYTMIPLSDDSDPQINTMVLENKTNITNIPNFSINL